MTLPNWPGLAYQFKTTKQGLQNIVLSIMVETHFFFGSQPVVVNKTKQNINYDTMIPECVTSILTIPGIIETVIPRFKILLKCVAD